MATAARHSPAPRTTTPRSGPAGTSDFPARGSGADFPARDSGPAAAPGASRGPGRPSGSTGSAPVHGVRRRPGRGRGRTSGDGHPGATTPGAGSSPVAEPVSVPLPSLRHFGPQWYAAVMGTASVAGAGTALGADGPHPVARPLLAAVWALAALLLVAVWAARAAHWRHHRDQARAHLLDPAVAPFYGCAAMAPLAVGMGALGPGRDIVGEGAAVPVAAALFALGCALALMAAAVVPYLLIVRHRTPPGSASPVWLLPLVAPMVAAAFAPLLAAELPPGDGRRTLLAASLGLAGASALATLVVLPAVVARLIHHGPLPLALTPSLFLVLGPLGQSATAAGYLADALPGRPYADVTAVLYGVPVTGFALLWLAVAGALVLRAVRRGLPFTLGWWAFTFPVGTCVTGAAGLAHRTELGALSAVAVALYGLLVAAWAVAGVRTVRGLFSGSLLAGPPPAPGAPSPATARTRSDSAR
ncbi:C4-dicarboxylate ABC transporter [Streptomyces sp. NPDC094448]|uniref:SLAC1 family transporter n=1 Tax=Streptomyces sp. NPDC094448 TaxID=3366063 RepID=UPI0037FFA1D3